MSSLHLAFIAVILVSMEGIIWKFTLDRKGCPWATLILYHIIAAVILIPFTSFSAVTEVDFHSGKLLFFSCLLWVVGDFFSAKAYQYLDAAVCEVYGTLKLVFITLAGVFIFSESITPITIMGIGLIIAAIAYQLDLKNLKLNKGVNYKALSIFFHAGAFIVDKELTLLVAEETIVFYGFLLPAIIYSICGHKYFKNVSESVRESGYVFLFAPLLGAAYYFCLIKALAGGDLSVTYIIQETAIIFIFILEVLLLKAHENLFRKAVSCLICAAGAILVCGVV